MFLTLAKPRLSCHIFCIFLQIFFFVESIYILDRKPEAKMGRRLLTTVCGIVLGVHEVTCEAS